MDEAGDPPGLFRRQPALLVLNHAGHVVMSTFDRAEAVEAAKLIRGWVGQLPAVEDYRLLRDG